MSEQIYHEYRNARNHHGTPQTQQTQQPQPEPEPEDDTPLPNPLPIENELLNTFAVRDGLLYRTFLTGLANIYVSELTDRYNFVDVINIPSARTRIFRLGEYPSIVVSNEYIYTIASVSTGHVLYQINRDTHETKTIPIAQLPRPSSHLGYQTCLLYDWDTDKVYRLTEQDNPTVALHTFGNSFRIYEIDHSNATETLVTTAGGGEIRLIISINVLLRPLGTMWHARNGKAWNTMMSTTGENAPEWVSIVSWDWDRLAGFRSSPTTDFRYILTSEVIANPDTAQTVSIHNDVNFTGPGFISGFTQRWFPMSIDENDIAWVAHADSNIFNAHSADTLEDETQHFFLHRTFTSLRRYDIPEIGGGDG